MIVRREALSAALAITTAKDTRYFLDAVQIRANGDVAATDGHVALVIHDPEPFPVADFPAIAGADIHGALGTDCIVPADTCKRLIDAMPKRPTIDILAAVRIGRNGAANTAVLAATDLSVPAVALIDTAKPDVTFPKIDRVIPAADPELAQLTLGVPALEALLKAAKALGAASSRRSSRDSARTQTITFQIPAPTTNSRRELLGTVRVDLRNAGNGLTVTGAIAPCKL